MTACVGEVINLGCGESISLAEMAPLVARKMNKPDAVITYVGDRPGQVFRHTADASKAERLLGWRPQVTFEEGLERTIAWYIANRAVVGEAALDARHPDHHQDRQARTALTHEPTVITPTINRGHGQPRSSKTSASGTSWRRRRPPPSRAKTLNLGFARMPLPRIVAARTRHGQGRDLWALRHVSFCGSAQARSSAIIGANGAGKSTLLKIIARVTRPTEGRVVGIGRVVSLLELGAGFNPDFSAHDNILMNAAMHGISRREALDRMAEIIQFAELDEFLDNPLRQYSSGMYLRLAFSVAINMQPDILLADEILAVGDIAFQERCLAARGARKPSAG